jgi:dolichol-phosphate mannosyltransferase
MEQRKLSIIIPAYNEGLLVEKTFIEVMSATNELEDFEVLLVNDGSTDDTGTIMSALAERYSNVAVIQHYTNLGIGAAYNSGVHAATREFVILVPGDNNFEAGSLRHLFSHVGLADIIIPYHLNADKSRPLYRRIISTAYTKLANYLSGKSIPYYNSIVIHRTDAIKKVGIRTNGFAYQLDLIVRMLDSGASYALVGIFVNERVTGKTKAFKIRNVVQVVSVFINLVLQRN